MTSERRWKAMILPWGSLAAAIFAGVTWVLPMTESPDSARTSQRLSDERSRIQRLFLETIEHLSETAGSIAADSSLVERSLTSDPLALAQALDDFSRTPLDEGQGIELVDARGSVLLWHGRTWGSRGVKAGTVEAVRTRATVERVGAVVVVRVNIPGASAGSSVWIHQALSVDAAGLERVFGRPAFAQRAEEIASRAVRIIPSQEFSGQADAVSLVAFERDTLAFALLPHVVIGPPNGRADSYPGVLTSLMTVVALLGMWLWLTRIARVRNDWWGTTGLVVAVWVTRLLLGALGLPARLSLGDAVDPRVYAAPSVGGLTASPLDLLISSAALFASVWLVEDRIARLLSAHRPSARRPLWAAIAIMVLSAGILVYLSRGFVVAVHSLVTDSTVSLYDPATIVVPVAGFILLSALFLLTLAYRSIWVLTMRWVSWLTRWIGIQSILASWALVVGAIGFAAATFLIVDRSQIVPWWVFLWSSVGALLILVTEDVLKSSRLMRWIPQGLAVLMMSLPVVDRFVDDRVLDDVQRRLEERVRPRDSWYAFLLTTDLRALSTDAEAADILRSDRRMEPGLSAFRLWSRTLLSQQQLNTGIAIFDRQGNERDRFMAGIGTYQQQMILRAVFEGNEETVHALDLQTGPETQEFHGAWSTIRGPGNEVFGTVALLASTAEQETIILSTVGVAHPGRPGFQTVEYSRDKVLRSTDPLTAPGTILDPAVRRMMEEDGRSTVRREEEERRATDVYVRDPYDPDRILGAVVAKIDLRWQIFHTVKIAMVFGILGLLGAFTSRGWRRSAAGWPRSFRMRLFTAFAFIALVPLVLLALYNRSISSERTARNVEQSLTHDLGLIQQRIESTISGEEDLELGLTDDFCAAVAADLGIEFSVFRGERLQASSRPELYASAVLETRMPADAFGRIRLRGEPMAVTTERIGTVTYAVGYGAFFLAGRPAGVIAVPMLYRQAGIEEDLLERNAFLVVAAAGVFILVLLLGGGLSGMIAEPVQRLTDATERIREGRTPASLHTRRRDELGTLMNTFDRMAKELDENRLRIARAEREQAWREMAKQVAHEIKNPLTPMKLSLQHVRQAFRDGAPDRESLLSKVISTVLEQVDALARIATEFSRFARLPERTFTRVDVLGTIREAAGLFSGVHGVTWRLALPATEAVVVADADELRRVFINLFRNSIQAMDDRGEIQVSGEVTGSILLIRIHDTGPGIAPDVRDRIFEPSFSTKTDGMGLGLAIVRTVVTDLGGSIELVRATSGTEFQITLPVHAHA